MDRRGTAPSPRRIRPATARTLLPALWIAAALAGCASEEKLVTSTPSPGGYYDLYNKRGSLVARGRANETDPDGRWIFFEDARAPLAEITYRNGVANGPAKIWFTSKDSPVRVGSLRMIGEFLDGQPHGTFVTFHPSGKQATRRIFANGNLLEVVAFSPSGSPLPSAAAQQAAASQTTADQQLLKQLDAIAREGIANPR